MSHFREALEDCDLCDLGFKGPWYTWERDRMPENNVRERLDRAVANSEWWEMHLGFLVSHLNYSFSDHCPALIDTSQDTNSNNGTSRALFHFEANWALEEGVE
ncbi:hypothetical protein HRI_003225700 [Hibiscus trionum]|uniref:Reverse transcriptase n=1 Tax=Hibiscus trionum TaxID=183268 RepID=A0A9W7IEX4_HIBTR|nr:hypothetical protein HRI_003225700 [Hibiscus trionum]